jgi:hypothetical protein
MPRATDADVRAYVEMESSTSTAPYITSASVVSDTYLAGKGLSELILTQIEIFLAAHFAVLAVERGGIQRDTQGDAAQTYQSISEKLSGFMLTRFGQQAVALDSTKTLVGVGGVKLSATFRVVGDASVDRAS